MPQGVTLQAQSPATAHADLGFVLGTMISGKPMAMREAEHGALIEAIAANRFVLPRNRQTGARITEKGTAIVELHGVLIDRAPYIGAFWGMTAYEGIQEQCRRLASNDDVKRIVLDINSPGGMVLGIEACANALAALADKKPMFAIANNMACSGGYWLAAIADELSITPNGEVGSIGVVVSRVSYSEMLEREGIAAHMFTAGAAKGDGRAYSILTDSEAAETQYGIDRVYQKFAAHVAKHRGMSDDAVRETDARCFSGADAIDAGLADRTETLEELVARIEKNAARPRARRKSKPELSSKGGLAPLERIPAPPPADDSEPTAGKTKGAHRMSTAQADEGRTDLSAMITAAIAAGRAQATAAAAHAASVPAPASAPAATNEPKAPAATTDGDRIFAILECEEAKTRPALARTLAKNPKLSVDEARALLAAAAVETQASTDDGRSDALAKEMAKRSNSAGIKAEGDSVSKAPSLADRVEARFAKKGT